MKRKHKKISLAKMSPGEMLQHVNKSLGYDTLIRPPKYWLDTGFKYLNKVMGSKEYGLAYGKMYLIAGPPSSGKSALAAWIAGLGQKDGASVAKVDGENSFDREHDRHQGLDAGHRLRNIDGKVVGYTKIALFQPEYGIFKHKKKKGGDQRISKEDVEAAEMLFDRVELWMKLQRKAAPDGKRIVIVDSTTSFCPEEEMMATHSEQNMRTRTSSAVFLNGLAKKWVNLALHTNSLVLFIAQLRHNPGKAFGNPEYVTGGNGIQYFSSCVVWVRRSEDGAIKQNGEQVGTKGTISNRKNKVGGGSIERKKCAYKCYFYKDAWNFMRAKKKGE
jgi:RecA/RadA recombinase